MADGRDIDFTPYMSGGNDAVADIPAQMDTPAIDFSKYASPVPSTPKGQIDFSQVADSEREMARSIAQGAQSLGADPTDYATAMSYESARSFDPWAKGPVTKWGQHRGTIQYGEPQQKEFGVTPNQSFHDQVTDSNVRYLQKNGFKAGMGFDALYKAINGGKVTAHTSTPDANTGRTIGDNLRLANKHRQEVINRFGQYFNDPALSTAATPQPSVIQPGASAPTQITPEEQQAFDARFPVETYSPGYVDPNAVTPEQNAQNVIDAVPELTAISDAAAKGERYVDPSTQLVLEGGYKQAPDQANVQQGAVRITKDGQNYLAKQVGDKYSVEPETPINTTDADYQQWLPASGYAQDGPEARKAYSDALKESGQIAPELAAQVGAVPTSQKNVQRLFTQWQTAPKPLDDVHFRATEIPYLVTIPDGVNKSQYATEAANQYLANEWGLTPEQVKQLNWKVPALGPQDKHIIAYMNRGDLVNLIGADKVKADYYGEMPPQGLNPLENEQKAAAKPLTDNPFTQATGDPLMDQARANIYADPFSAGTDEAVQKEYERLRRTTPGEWERKATDKVGEWLSSLDPSGVNTGFVKGAAWLGDIISGATKLSPIGLLDYATGRNSGASDAISRLSNDARLVAQSSSDHDTFVFELGGQQVRPRAVGEALGQAGVQVPVYVGLSTLPGGAVMAFATTEGLGSLGRGDNLLDVTGNTIKGGALGAVFLVAPRIGQLVADQVLRTAVNPVFEAGTEVGTGAILASKILGTTAELGTIGGGTFAIEKVSGASNKDAFNAAIVNTLFGLTKYVPLDSLAGKTYRMHDGSESADVTIDPDGSVKLLKGEVPPGAVDAEFDVSKVVDMKPDHTGVYRAEGDTEAAPPKVGEPIARLGEAPAKRIEQPLPEAVQRLPLDSRAQKIGGVLADGEPKTIQEIAKATRYNLGKVNETVELLYGAGKIEVLPDSRIRLIEPLDKGSTSLYERFNEKGVSQPPAPMGESTSTPKVSEQVTATEGTAVPIAAQQNGNIPETTADVTNRPVAPTITPEQRAEAEQSTGIATQVSPEQAARDVGSVTKDGVMYTRQEPLPETSPTGNTGKVKFAENESPDFTYRIISADHLQPAHINGVLNHNHFLPEAQPKVRTDKASVKAADSIAAKINLDEVGESPNAYAGAPVINSRGEVIQGNNRAAGIKLSYGQNDDYKKQLAVQAAKFGFTHEQVNAIKNPVLVRQVNADDNEAIRLGNFDELDTTSGGIRRIDPGKIAARIPHENKAKILSDVFLNAPEDASLTDLIRDNQAQVVGHLKPYLSDTQQQSMVENGKLTPKAVEDVKDTFTHFLFAGGKHELPELFDQLPDKAQKGLTAALPSIFGVSEHSSLVTEIQNAIAAANTYAEFKEADPNLSWDNWASQPNMFHGGLAPKEIFTPTEMAIAQRLHDAKKTADIKSLFADYARLVNGIKSATDGGSLNLLADGAASEGVPGISKAAAVKEIFNVEHQERQITAPQGTAQEFHQPTDKGTGSAPETERPGTQLQPAAEKPERTASPERRAVRSTSTLDPLTTARVLYGREQGMTDSDIAQRYDLDPEAVTALAPLPPVGQGGQTSHKIIQNFVPSKTATPEEYSDKVAMTNDLISEMGIPTDQRLTRDSSPGEVKTALDAARLKIANEMGKDRGSHMDSSDWLKWLDAHAAKLSHDTTSGILDALGHQIIHNEKVDAFISDKNLVDAITRVHTTYGIDRIELADFGGIPNSDLKKEILQLGYSYGLKKTAIERAYQRGRAELLEGIRQRSETGSEGRNGAPGATPVETSSANQGSGNEEELAPQRQSIQLEAAPIRLPPVTNPELPPVTEADSIPATPIDDFGEKIGGARKDTAESGFTMRGGTKTDEPKWMKGYQVGEDPEGGFRAMKVKDRIILWEANDTFDTKEAAINAVKLHNIAEKFGISTYAKEGEYEVYRRVGKSKRELIQGGFKDRAEAGKYLVMHVDELLDYKPVTPDRPHIENLERTGKEYRQGNVNTKQFLDAFGFKGGEFGNWVPQDERQRILNMAYDGLHDLADVLGVPPEALSLGGQLSIAFGSRGHGLSGAAAHYERQYAVFNLTRLNGAGAVAHEWFHALDNYFGLADRGKTFEKDDKGVVKEYKDSDRSKFWSHGTIPRGFARAELRDVYRNLIQMLFKQPKLVEVSLKRYEGQVEYATKERDQYIQQLRNYIEKPYEYARRAASATSEQLKIFEGLIDRIKNGDVGEDVPTPSKKRFDQGKTVPEVFKSLDDLMKSIRGRGEFREGGRVERILNFTKSIERANGQLEHYRENNIEEQVTPTKYKYDAKDLDKTRVSEYFSTPHEMAARAFEGYVEDKIVGRGDKSQYLVHSTHNSIYKLLYGLNPYPEGVERERIDAAFDKFFHTLETKVDDKGNTILFSSTTFDQTDLFANPLTPQTEQPSMFDMGAPVEAKEAVATRLKDIIDPKTADYLNSLAQSDNKAVSKAANILIGSSKYARSTEAKKAIEDAADALDTFARAEQAHTSVGNILAQQNLDGRTVAETITPQAATFARAMENGDLGRTLNSALSNRNLQIQDVPQTFSVDEPPSVLFDIPNLEKRVTKEKRQARLMMLDLNKLTQPQMVAQADIQSNNGVLEPRNMQGLTILHYAVAGIDPGKYGATNFAGAYFDPTAAKSLQRVINNAIDNAMATGQVKSATKLSQIADAVANSIDPAKGDLVVALNDPKLPAISKTTRQEELAHRNNATSGAKDIFVDIASTPAIQKSLANLDPAYARIGVTDAVDEVIAKSFRDDAEVELGISKQEARENRKELFKALQVANISPSDYADAIKDVSRSGAAFARYAGKRSQRSIQDESAGAGEVGTSLSGVSPIRGERPGDSGESIGENTDRRSVIRQTKLLSSGRREGEPGAIAFAKNTLVRKALDKVDRVLSTSEFSTTRALENVVNKGLQQLKKADEDAYEQVLKLAGTAAHATLEAMRTGVRDPAFVDALRSRNLDDVRITLELAGLAQPVTPGSTIPAKVAGKPASQMRIGDKPYYVPTWLKTELSNVLASPHDPNVIQKLVDKLDTIGMAGPLDLFYHGTNVIATVIGGTPYAGTGILSRTIGNTPATKWLTTLVNTWRMNPEKVLAREPGLLREMAEAGVIPASYGTKTYSRRLAGVGTAKKVAISLAPLLKGPKGLDIRTRILMWKIGKHMNPNASPTEMNDFVNQLGIYDKALQSQAVRFLTNSRIGRFAVAGTTMSKNGMLAWLNKNPLPIEDLPFAERTWVRAQQQFSGGPLGIAVILWMGLSLLYRGMLPWKDEKSQFMRIPLNDSDRHSPLVEKVYGSDGDVFVNLAFFSPLLERGGNALGINSAYNTAVLGGNKTQMAEAALTSSLNTAIHPVSTSPTTRAVFEGLTGNEMSIKGLRDKAGKSTLEQWPLDLPEGAGIGRKALEGVLDLNPFVGSIIHSFGVNRSDRKPDLLTDSENHILLQSMLGMILPRLIKKTDLGKKRGYIREQKWAMR